jgi:3-dehydroquinate synthase
MTVIRIPAGEKSKTRAMKNRLEDKLLRAGIDRHSILIALGGGVIGDLCGFVASTLLRGIEYIHIPTSLLAQVDSSVGGKVAVNHPRGKNLIGAFHQPAGVYIDITTLKTLPETEFRNGLAEIIKYAATLDKKLFRYLEDNSYVITQRRRSVLLPIIQQCCKLKRDVIQIDERENNYRRILNFGHTIGHAIEQLSGYRTPHGTAVAIGMCAEAKISMLMGLLKEQDYERLTKLVESYGLPTKIPKRISLLSLIDATLNDKKSQNNLTYYTLLRSIGNAVVGVPFSQKQILSFLSA